MTLDELQLEARNEAFMMRGTIAKLLCAPAAYNITWNESRGRFVINGRSVLQTTMQTQLRRIEKYIGGKIDDLCDQLEAKTITADQWGREFKRLIGISHMLNGALATGSISAAATNLDVQARITAEAAYADQFAREITQ